MNAKELREMMPSYTLENRAKNILATLQEKMKEVALKDGNSIRLSVVGYSEVEDTINEGYNTSSYTDRTAGGLVLGKLASRGFKIKFLYEDNYFVNMDWIISW